MNSGPAGENLFNRSEFDFFVKMVNQIGDELMLVDADARIVFVNEAAVHGLGYPREELLSKKIVDLFRRRMSVATWKKQQLAVLRREHRPISLQLERVVKDGSLQAIEVTAVLMVYDGREYVLSVTRNVTQQVAWQKQIKEMAEFYHMLCEQAADPILILDRQGNISYANRATEQLLSSKKEHLVGKPLENYVWNESLPKYRDFAAHALKASPGRNTVEMEVVDADGEPIPVELSLSPVLQVGKELSFHIIARDLRSRREIEQLMIESEKMQAVQYFVTGAAQELKHPLMGVVKNAQALLDKYRNRDFEYIGHREFKDIMQILENIAKQVKYCCTTAERLENLNRRKGRIPNENCYIPAVVGDILKIREAELKAANIVCKSRIPHDLPIVAVGAIEFNQMITSLINNAIEAMPAGGVLGIRGTFLKASQEVQIEVKDNGIGIDPEVLPHIFEPFYTTKQRGVDKHAGLGLTVVYSLVNECGGKIKIQSSRSQGTAIRLFFAIKDKKAEFPRS